MKNINWDEWFIYDDGILRWRKCTSRTGSGPNQPGKEAGCVGAYGYRVVNLQGKQYAQHRIIWEMHHGIIPADLTVDHIDRDKLNNRISNLRLADVFTQNANRDANLIHCPVTGRFKRRDL